MVEIQRRGELRKTASLQFGDALDEWLEKEVSINSKESTYDTYSSIIRNHLPNTIQSIPLKKITTSVLQDWLNNQGIHYSRSTVHSCYAVLRAAFNWLVKNRKYLTENPMIDVTMPKTDEIPKSIRVFTADEMSAIFAKWPSGHRYHLPIALAYYAGLRLGECLALTWDNVDLTAGTLTITSTLYDHQGLPILSEKPSFY